MKSNPTHVARPSREASHLCAECRRVIFPTTDDDVTTWHHRARACREGFACESCDIEITAEEDRVNVGLCDTCMNENLGE